MAFIQWRRFGFFDKQLVKDGAAGPPPGAGDNAPSTLQSIDITACTSGGGQVIFGDSSGYIHLADRKFQLSSFQAYNVSVTHLKQMKQRNILISVGEDEEGINPTIKVWNLDKMDRNKLPTCTRTIKVAADAGTTSPVSVIAALENLSQLAVGLANGVVVLYRGDISRDRFTKPKVVHRGQDPITGLGFREQGKTTYLYVVTPNYADAYVTSTLFGKETRERLDEIGCDLKCCVTSEPDADLVLARTEAVYFYTHEGRGPCFAFEGQKEIVSWFRNYLIIGGRDAKLTETQRASGLQTVNIYDVKNKLVAFTGNFMSVQHIFSEWGSVFLLTRDKQLFQLEEKDTASKLDMLFSKNLYPMAITLASANNYDTAAIIEIYQKFGDHLYSKGDYDGAMTQYLKTIGRLEPSYVIRKFLDAQRIRNLTSYLQALHEQGVANADHTTLLLNCYTKLKDTERLDAFIRTDKELNFDVETAIRVCRQANFHLHALYLAEKFEQHEWYLKIQLEDVNNYTEALEYISKLPVDEAERNLMQYGKTLLNFLPEQTTALLKKLCTEGGTVSAATQRALQDDPAALLKRSRPRAEDLMHIFVNQTRYLTEFLEHMVASLPDASPVLYNTLLELYLKQASGKDMPDGADAKAAASKDRSIQQARFRESALELLKRPNANFDWDQAMVLCKLYDFKAGVLFLYERNRMFAEIVQYYMDNNEYSNILATCKKYSGTSMRSEKDQVLWVRVLSYFASQPGDCSKEISEVLHTIDQYNLLPPLQVVQILSQNSSVTLSVVKDYISSRMLAEDKQIKEDARQIKQYEEETERMRAEIEDLKTTARIFQLMKCSACSNPLDLPATHFLCMHSFHQRCLGDNERECPMCAPANRTILEIKRSQEANAQRHDQFYKQLEIADDGFSVVADYFGRNVFNKIVLLDGAGVAGPSRSAR